MRHNTYRQRARNLGVCVHARAFAARPPLHPPSMAAPPPTLLCVGDSHTQGTSGTDWVAALARRHPNLRVVNAGVNAEWAEMVAARLPALLDAHPGVVGVTLLAGTNDVLAAESAAMRGFYRLRFGAAALARVRPPSPEGFEAAIDGALRALREKAPAGCRVALLTLPPVGERLGDAANARAARYNEVLARAAAAARARGLDVALFDFGAACRAHLEAAGPVPGRAGAPPAFALGSWWGLLTWYPWALLRRRALRQGWDAIARAGGMRLLTDQVHLSDAAAELLLAELAPWADGVAAAAAAAAAAGAGGGASSAGSGARRRQA